MRSIKWGMGLFTGLLLSEPCPFRAVKQRQVYSVSVNPETIVKEAWSIGRTPVGGPPQS